MRTRPKQAKDWLMDENAPDNFFNYFEAHCNDDRKLLALALKPDSLLSELFTPEEREELEKRYKEQVESAVLFTNKFEKTVKQNGGLFEPKVTDLIFKYAYNDEKLNDLAEKKLCKIRATKAAEPLPDSASISPAF